MKLREIISEMSMPAVNDPTKASEIIRQAYNTAVVKKTPNTNLYGPLEAALQFFQKSPNAMKYQGDIKKGVAAKKAMSSYRGTKAKQEVQFRAKPERQSFEKKV